MREVKIGGRYKHFKGYMVRVICLAKDSEDLEEMVVYYHEGEEQNWVRPVKAFLSEVDHQKYPDVQQKYRFELVEE